MNIRLFTIPNMITLANLACGCLSLVYCLSYGNLQVAFYFIVAGAVLDFLDGFAARMLRSYSDIGKQLDSLSDVVTFGVAPSAMLMVIMKCTLPSESVYVAYSAFVLALFSALRLAKFNVDPGQSDSFTGLPTPACALLVSSAGFMYAAQDTGFYHTALSNPWITLSVTAVLSLLLISPIRMFSLKFKNFSLRINAVRYSFILISLAGLLFYGVGAIGGIIAFYILLSIVLNLACTGSDPSRPVP